METVKAWKDPLFRREQSAEAAAVPQHPAGAVQLADDDLSEVGGGSTWGCAIFGGGIAVTIALCSPNGTLCGSCKWGTAACC
jgi:mersacidin/lichenicidin family type 2 lantibiotic